MAGVAAGSNEDLKRKHELAVAARFVEYLGTIGRTVTEPQLGDIRRREPDALCLVDGQRVGIEIGCAYYDREEARNVWAVARGHPERSRRVQQPGETVDGAIARQRILVNFNHSLACELNRTLHAHVTKTYGVPSYLVLDAYREHAPLTSDTDATTIFAILVPPETTTFLGIYVCLTSHETNAPIFLLLE